MSLNQNQSLSANRQVITVIKPLHLWLTLTNITPYMFLLTCWILHRSIKLHFVKWTKSKVLFWKWWYSIFIWTILNSLTSDLFNLMSSLCFTVYQIIYRSLRLSDKRRINPLLLIYELFNIGNQVILNKRFKNLAHNAFNLTIVQLL